MNVKETVFGSINIGPKFRPLKVWVQVRSQCFYYRATINSCWAQYCYNANTICQHKDLKF
jgi:hypothetical protein